MESTLILCFDCVHCVFHMLGFIQRGWGTLGFLLPTPKIKPAFACTTHWGILHDTSSYIHWLSVLWIIKNGNARCQIMHIPISIWEAVPSTTPAIFFLLQNKTLYDMLIGKHWLKKMTVVEPLLCLIYLGELDKFCYEAECLSALLVVDLPQDTLALNLLCALKWQVWNG